MARNDNSLAGYRVTRILVPIVLFLLAISPASADYYVGVKTGYLSVDGPKKSNPTNLALGLGVDIDNDRMDLRLEGEFSQSIADGETRLGNDLEFESRGLYLVARGSRSLFTVLRVGLVENRLEGDGDSERDEGVAFGIGFGGVIGNVSLLLEYTDLAGDASFLSLTLEF